jgi:hypothetical protein
MRAELLQIVELIEIDLKGNPLEVAESSLAKDHV